MSVYFASGWYCITLGPFRASSAVVALPNRIIALHVNAFYTFDVLRVALKQYFVSYLKLFCTKKKLVEFSLQLVTVMPTFG